MSLPNIVLLGNFGVKRSVSEYFSKFLPFALKYYDSGLNAHFELKEDLSFTWYQKRNMTANLLKQRPVDTGLMDQYINVSGLGFEDEITQILRHGWKNVITDADYPAQEPATILDDWTDIPSGDYYTIQRSSSMNEMADEYMFCLIVNFNATNNNVKLKLFPDLKEFNFTIPLGGALGFLFKTPMAWYPWDVIQVCQILVLSSGFKFKFFKTTQNPNTKVFNVKFQEFQDTGVPPLVPASNEIDGNETVIYLFNLTG